MDTTARNHHDATIDAHWNQVCPDCGGDGTVLIPPMAWDVDDTRMIDADQCDRCHGTGYTGEVAA